MCVQNAIAAMRSFPGKGQLRPFAVKLRSPLNQLLDTLRTFLHQHPGRIGIHDAIAGIDCVLQVQADFILIA
jgi:hypothetical protein